MTAGLALIEYEPMIVYLRQLIATQPSLAGLPIEERPIPPTLAGPVITYQLLAALDSRNASDRMVLANAEVIVSVWAAGDSLQVVRVAAHALNTALDSETANAGDVVTTENGDRWYVNCRRMRMYRGYPDMLAGGLLGQELGGVFRMSAHVV